MNQTADSGRATALDTRPFFLPGGPVGCLLLHGFTATPYDMRFLGQRLHEHGLTVSAIRLPGHATSSEDMERYRWADWVEAARAGLSELGAKAGRVVLVGQSMGALLALKLAAERAHEIDALALMSTALVVSARWMYWTVPLAGWLAPVLPAALRFVVKGDSDIADAAARAVSPTYRRVPIRSVHELLRLQAHVRSLLPRIQQPVLALHSSQDHVCPLENVDILQRELAGPVHTAILSRCYHVISVDVEKERAAREIVAFFSAALQQRRYNQKGVELERRRCEPSG